jgi:hypothetical protein
MKNPYEKSKLELKVSLVFLLLLFLCHVAYLYYDKNIEIIQAIIATAKIYSIFICFGIATMVFLYIATVARNYWRLKVKKTKDEQNRLL